jgi:glycerate-2-kinase
VHQSRQIIPLILPASPVRSDLSRILESAINAVDPYAALSAHVSLQGHTLRADRRVYDLRRVGRVVVVGAGKAAVPMAHALVKVLGRRLEGGLVAAPGKKALPAVSNIQVVTAGHPIPDRSGLGAARRVMDLARSLEANDLLIVLLSGGASSLLPLPAEGLTLQDKQRTTSLLLRSGATITEVNTVRKHLSAIKGGRLAQATRAQVLTLVLSDVGGDTLGTIGSGPTAPDPTTFRDAVRIIREHGLWQRMPVRARIHLVEGLAGWQEETPSSRSRIFTRVDHVIIGNNRMAVEAAAQAAHKLKYEIVILDEFLTGEAAQVGNRMGTLGHALQGAHLRRRLALIAGGELTVTANGKGQGGRAQEFALAGALSLQGTSGVCLAGMGTDGRDGPTDSAGAVVDGGTVARGKRKGYDAARYLARNDSYRFFKHVGGHIKTGLTGTNVNDLYLMLVRPQKQKISLWRH